MKLLMHPAAAAQIEAFSRLARTTVMLHGPEGVGKYTTAQELARRLNCEGGGGAKCRSCTMWAGSNHPMIITMKPDEKNKIGIDQVHELQHELHYTQYHQSGQRVVIIDGADRLTLPAQQALLKTLEEPPEGTTIIVVTGAPQALLPTIQSRCVEVYLPPLPNKQLLKELQQLFPNNLEVVLASELSGGAPGKALDYLHNHEKLEQDQAVTAEVQSLLTATATFDRLRQAASMGGAPHRELYVAALETAVRNQARIHGETSRFLLAVEDLRLRLGSNVNPKTAFEAFAVAVS